VEKGGEQKVGAEKVGEQKEGKEKVGQQKEGEGKVAAAKVGRQTGDDQMIVCYYSVHYLMQRMTRYLLMTIYWKVLSLGVSSHFERPYLGSYWGFYFDSPILL